MLYMYMYMYTHEPLSNNARHNQLNLSFCSDLHSFTVFLCLLELSLPLQSHSLYCTTVYFLGGFQLLVQLVDCLTASLGIGKREGGSEGERGQ